MALHVLLKVNKAHHSKDENVVFDMGEHDSLLQYRTDHCVHSQYQETPTFSIVHIFSEPFMIFFPLSNETIQHLN